MYSKYRNQLDERFTLAGVVPPEGLVLLLVPKLVAVSGAGKLGTEKGTNNMGVLMGKGVEVLVVEVVELASPHPPSPSLPPLEHRHCSCGGGGGGGCC